MKNHVNCWNAKSKDKPISIQASHKERKVQRLSVKTEYTSSEVEAHDILRDEDIVRSPEKSEGSEVMLYIISSNESTKFYIGITNNVKRRINTHRLSSKTKNTKLYSWMRKYTDWELKLVNTYSTREEANQEEIFWISFGRSVGWNLLNISDGGEGGFCVKDIEGWKSKLSEKRLGRKPALGMKHSDENKKYFAECAHRRWEGKTYPNNIISYPFKEANEIFGISKTHYYRLKRASGNV